MLFETFMEPCVLMERKRVPDGEGGFVVSWTEGAEIEAAIIMDNSTEARAAEHDGMTSVYTVTTRPTAALDYHDVIKRLSDGRIFRITSDSSDKMTPNVATFQFRQASAERWELTT